MPHFRPISPPHSSVSQLAGLLELGAYALALLADQPLALRHTTPSTKSASMSTTGPKMARRLAIPQFSQPYIYSGL